ncbi:MAG: glycerol-3-phosphate dehydrogenase/oxidase [Bacteroidales bacterium]|nr:glycerol-3-phosphate dehydrogenase/oxidase [Bacteroidales bacterium]
MNRQQQIIELQRNKEKIWDIIVIGGGATGLGIALDAVTRGYKTLLLEQSDFAKGTSSRSTKLVHGGVRYLARGDILLVTEALHERGRMLKNAPNLTANQEFVIPVYTLWDVILYTVGLKFYDLLAGRLSLGKSYFISRSKAIERLPLLKTEGLKGGIVYHDGQFDDSRMAIALAVACIDKGGTILNYFKVVSLLKNEKGRIRGVRARDLETGNEFSINAKLVINATGVFTDEIHRMDNPSSKPTIRPSQGVHIVLDSSFLNSKSAIMIPKTDDGRVLFAIPWYGKVVVGTTDTPLDTISMEPRALDEEISFILKTAGKYLVRPPSREDVLCIFAGLRPLAANPDNPSATREVSRRHKITLSSSGLLSIIGGKWTSYRRMAEETIDKGIKAGILDKRKCITKNFRFYSNNTKLRSERLKIYGDKAGEIEKMISEEPGTAELLNSVLPYTKAEITWICRNEMPVTLEDILARRTRSLFLDVRTSLKIAPQVAGIIASELNRDKKWEEEQINAFTLLSKNYL